MLLPRGAPCAHACSRAYWLALRCWLVVQTLPLPGRPTWDFTYRVRVTNQRDEPVQLMSREWTIQVRAAALRPHSEREAFDARGQQHAAAAQGCPCACAFERWLQRPCQERPHACMHASR